MAIFRYHLTDSTSVAETLSRQPMTITLAATDVVVATDKRGRRFDLSGVDSILIDDELLKIIVAIATDAINASDVLLAISYRNIPESIVVSEELSSGGSTYNRTLAETLTLSETLTHWKLPYVEVGTVVPTSSFDLSI